MNIQHGIGPFILEHYFRTGHWTFYFRTVKLWNDLCPKLKLSMTIQDFKRKLKRILFKQFLSEGMWEYCILRIKLNAHPKMFVKGTIGRSWGLDATSNIFKQQFLRKWHGFS